MVALDLFSSRLRANRGVSILAVVISISILGLLFLAALAVLKIKTYAVETSSRLTQLEEIRREISRTLDCTRTNAANSCSATSGPAQIRDAADNTIVGDHANPSQIGDQTLRANCVAQGTDLPNLYTPEYLSGGTWRPLLKVPLACPTAPIVVPIPLQCAHVNASYVNNSPDPAYEKRCSVTFPIATYYPAAHGQTYSRIGVAWRFFGYVGMAGELGNGLHTSLPAGRRCNNSTAWSESMGYYPSDPIFVTTSAPSFHAQSPVGVLVGPGLLQTNAVSWGNPVPWAHYHAQRLVYTPSLEHGITITDRLNGWGGCSNNNCGACISDIVVFLYP